MITQATTMERPSTTRAAGRAGLKLAVSTVEQGKKAAEEFLRFVELFGDEGATGEAFGYIRNVGRLKQKLLGPRDLAKLMAGEKVYGMYLGQYEYLLIDSGNAMGDSWKSFYFPAKKLLHFIREN